ncbi:ABC transporter substrate-binding protein [Thermotoga petrophila]|jgi:branched-chain amino acid transport system substrate-binding protein|uniref:Extracellular ligand-binding receptor n=2 Tax=Thermotoga petrophila TaxID=93929 RepID=A5IN43_THEP1|nr:ABC transporter substrate-binding protein [Thermotoga petrophila]ABQ47616.1 Extracellular ligand-binding receptor [Thermotoga petrophila RKU-1]MDK2893638.1 branched-chain amino acid transport system substrate-binding protein [Thermotoga sp.]MDK2898755.1 branched-chain amino acid transport system substrate-binding protein [Thermotoga sp.]
MRKVLVTVLLVLTVLNLFSAVKIGVILPMTGGISAFGRMVWEGIQIAYEEKPTVLGEKVELLLLDTRSEKTEAANAASRAIDKEKVLAIIGEVASAHSLAVAPIAEENKVPMITPASTNPLVTQGRKFVSRVCFIDPFQGVAMAVFAYKNLGAKRVVVFTDVEQDYSVGLSNFFKDKFTELGGQVKRVFFRSGDQDFSAQLSVAMSFNPDAIYITGYYPEIALISRQARQLGFTGYILAGDGADAPELIEIGGEAVEGLLFTTHYHPKAASNPVAKKFVEVYKEKYGKEPAALSALGYDAYMVLLDAIERAGGFDTEKIAEEIRKTEDFNGASGIINIDENGDAIKSVVVNVVKNGSVDFEAVINPGDLK